MGGGGGGEETLNSMSVRTQREIEIMDLPETCHSWSPQITGKQREMERLGIKNPFFPEPVPASLKQLHVIVLEAFLRH